jgi:F-type H+-transporting ATPase subunit gamma
MKMVAAAKLKKAQDVVTHFRQYAKKMHNVMIQASASVDIDEGNIYAVDRNYKQVLIVVITSNKGLCGAFNSNVIKEAVKLAERKYSKYLTADKIRYLAIGKKAYETLRKRKVSLEEPNTEIIENLTFDNAAELANSLITGFLSARYDVIDIVYNEFVNAASQIVICKQFLPLPIVTSDNSKTKQQTDYLFEPSKEYLVNELIPQNLRLTMYGALLDSVASEYGARMTSMHQATDNASTLIQDLTLQYNKARQASITNEILEIVGGAEALKG